MTPCYSCVRRRHRACAVRTSVMVHTACRNARSASIRTTPASARTATITASTSAAQVLSTASATEPATPALWPCTTATITSRRVFRLSPSAKRDTSRVFSGDTDTARRPVFSQSVNQSRFLYSGLSNLNHCEVHWSARRKDCCSRNVFK